MVSTARLCEGLGLSRHRLDQWISRGELEPQSEAQPGRPRDWDKKDAMRALITFRLWQSGVNLAADGAAERPLVSALRHLRGVVGERAYLVLRPVFPGGPVSKHIVAASRLAGEMAHPAAPYAFAIVIDLDEVEEKITATFPELTA